MTTSSLSDEERLSIAWGAFKRLLVKCLGPHGAASYLDHAVAVMKREAAIASKAMPEERGNVVDLAEVRG